MGEEEERKGGKWLDIERGAKRDIHTKTHTRGSHPPIASR